ncbi:hypothetical protein FDECE_1458, partial [Fusarium decemcellulare]
MVYLTDPHGLSSLMPLSLMTNVGLGPELQQRASMSSSQPSWQQDVTKDTGMVNCRETTFPSSDLDASINCSYGLLPVLPSFPECQSHAGIDSPAGGQKRQRSQCGSNPRSKRRRSGAQHNNIPPRKGGGRASGNIDGGHSDSDGDEEGDDEDDEDDDSKRKGKLSPQHNYACPFFQLDPEKHKSCGNCRLTTWARVLQHLKRKHLAGEHHCPKCRRSFDDED